MPIHFAAARKVTWSPVARALARRARGRAANDNINGDSPAIDSDVLLRRALEQFTTHGLGAASHAYAKAELALVERDREDFIKWHAICRALDRPMAERLEARQRRLDACA